MPLLGYFITFHTYGTWLHDHADGSVDEHAIPGTLMLPPDPACEQREHTALKHPPVAGESSASAATIRPLP